MNKLQNTQMAFAGVLAILAMSSGVLYAQTGAAPGDPAASSTQLAEIIITANKRPERLQDVPTSVTALDSAVLERGNVRELGDLVKLSPGLVVSYGTQPGNFSISLRGIGTFSNGIAVESDVAVVIDDVPLGFQSEAFKDLIDVDRVEVLRGPQSTLFGKSAIAGVLNIVTSPPTRTFEGKATILATDDGEKRAGVTVSGPLADDVRGRLTVAYSDFPGNVTNLTTGDKVNGTGGLTATGKIEWTPTEELTLSVAPRFNRNQSTCCVSPITSLTPGLYYQGLPQLPEAKVLAGIPIGPTNHYIRADDRAAGGDSYMGGITARMDYAFSDGSPLKGYTFSSISSTDRYRMHDYQDTDATDSPFLLYYPASKPAGIDGGSSIHGFFHADSVTQEFRLTSPGDTRLHYVAGLWYARNELNRYLKRGPVLSAANYLAISDNTSYSAFAQATFDVTEKLSLIGGARFNRQKIDYTFNNFVTIPNQFFSGANQENAITDKAGIEYKWTPDIMTFATYSTGYKGQAYDLVSTFNAREAAVMPVPHETAKNYELGLKTTLFDRRVYFDATLFDAEYFGFQTSVTTILPDGTYLTALNSVGHLRTRGVELDSQARVTPQFTLNGSYAYTEATIINFPNGPCYTGQTLAEGCYVDDTNSKVQNLRGKPLNNVPKHKFNVGGEYDQPLPGMPFQGFVAFTYVWQTAVNFALSQDPYEVQNTYGIADLSIGLNDNRSRYKVTAFVDNLFDKHYAVGLNDTTSGFMGVAGAVGTTWNLPRDAFRYYGLRVDVTF